MSEETGQGKAQAVVSRKQIVPFEEGDPAQEPMFVNYAQVAYAGGSAYIDVGLIALDDILSASKDATFLVLTRLVMSKETLIALGQQITALLSHEQVSHE
jgi:hypothetical protein